ncbi:dipeptide/oligopeptide/nickel ABC transporter ATPase [Amycolatopsis mediterranei S699]|uniref:ATPase component of ABC-type dipeptide/oligopeptide/nickel transport system n=2 Tax=Amycolatopsis mediterranei TaxID=33910 RepID=A0A0H3D5Y9_AMYMU|nr:oligopeptide/dipeptide ABC transporter ATP-binding protein [Amycolatopsis mediterranei]ADJ45523.1 ATPase component of ABC-type dipeptide/oligopeptide/nickel transport system [Amycolatopsis mediterranei U32]AEK42299.1 dipeptide/oligopeptide/nickel ABC transporter ATPase [Amycolatopsis mediterranei S699]AFO77235.1 dipeptide/oligopeptide/nickel ABC transporter ATPase [Amycolatopsis mediterranei S699]AGT84363.1 dipeptide/oligopeptide/nickel ABC transporter ATPase [Amycolatopsis mediterranei RB]
MTELAVRDLVKDFRVRDGVRRSRLRAVDGVSFTLTPGRTTALVGESGSGKSTIARLVTRLESPSSGRIVVSADDGAEVSGRAYRDHVQMVFQDPFASLNPFHTVEHHLARPLLLHGRARGREDTWRQVLHLLERVNLTPADEIARRRPHELSGGQRQRVAIARALAPGAKVIIADEPVSMLDVSIRLGVLNLLGRLQREDGLAVLYITHDLATARHFADDIAVLYRGRIVEHGPASEVILRPKHPYTQLLAAAAPDPDKRGMAMAEQADPAGGGLTPGVHGGCTFRDRCRSATAVCATTPAEEKVGDGHFARCWFPGAPA